MRRRRRSWNSQPSWRIVRYADDFVVLVRGDREHVEALHKEIADVLAPIGLRLSPAKTKIAHIDDGFEFLGVPHPAAPQTRNRPVVRLHLHR